MKTHTLLFRTMVTIAIVITGSITRATKYSIDVKDFTFSPSVILTVKIGDTIDWEWKNGSHTTTSKTIPAGASAWDQPIDASHTSYKYIPSVVGTYNYKCTPHESMGMVGSFTVISASGTTSLLPVSDILIYPNPFVDNVTVRINSTNDTWIRDITVFDLSGKTIRTVILENRRDFSENVIDLSDLPAGLLFLKFRDNFDRIFTRRIIHQ